MIVTEKELDTKWLLMFRYCKDVKRAKAEVLEHFSKEPYDGYEWSEQDIYEQMRKIIRKYE